MVAQINRRAGADAPHQEKLLPVDWRTGEHGVPYARYINRNFAALEAEKFWPFVWQMACRLDQIPAPGDYTVYDIVDQSVIIVRVDDNTIKAYHNVCPHRATALALGSGRFQLDTIACPFHGWKWNLHGKNIFILDPEEFTDDGHCFSLRECKAEIWMGGVWVNLDPKASPLDVQMAPILNLVEPLLIDHMKFHWHKSIVLNANWKVAQEAFVEAYHIAQTHPQLVNPRLGGRGLPTYAYETFPNGHGKFATVGAPALMGVTKAMGNALSQNEQVDALVRSLASFSDGLDCMVLAEDVSIAKSMRHRELPPGESVFDAFHRIMREYYQEQGRLIPDRRALENVTDMFIFPNITFLPTFWQSFDVPESPDRHKRPRLVHFRDIFS